MTKETLLQELSDKIREVCPELGDEHEPVYICNASKVDSALMVPGELLAMSQFEITKTGGEIHLEHVLRAIDSRAYAEYAMMTSGRIFEFSNQNTRINYDLALPFESQSVETLQFLHDIICK